MIRNDQSRFFFIWHANSFLDGECFPDDDQGRESLFRAITILGHETTAFEVREFIPCEETARDVTEDMVRAAFDDGWIDEGDILFDLYCQGASVGAHHTEHKLTGTDYGLKRMSGRL